jgi:MraZ protein
VFFGRHDHALDDKGRTMVPKEFRAVLSVLSQRSVMVSYKPGKPGCLEVRTVPSFQAFQRDFSRARKSALLERSAIVYFGSARSIELDRTGRLLLPPELRERLGLTERVAFVGIDGERFQLWRPDHLDDVYDFCDEKADDIQDALSEAFAQLDSSTD